MVIEGTFLRHMRNGKLLIAINTYGDEVEYVELPPLYETRRKGLHGEEVPRHLRSPFSFGQRLKITIEEAQ